MYYKQILNKDFRKFHPKWEKQGENDEKIIIFKTFQLRKHEKKIIRRSKPRVSRHIESYSLRNKKPLVGTNFSDSYGLGTTYQAHSCH